MATTTTTTTQTQQPPLQAKPPGPNKIFNQKGITYGDWRDEIVRDGYVVVKGAIPRERAEK